MMGAYLRLCDIDVKMFWSLHACCLSGGAWWIKLYAGSDEAVVSVYIHHSLRGASESDARAQP